MSARNDKGIPPSPLHGEVIRQLKFNIPPADPKTAAWIEVRRVETLSPFSFLSRPTDEKAGKQYDLGHAHGVRGSQGKDHLVLFRRCTEQMEFAEAATDPESAAYHAGAAAAYMQAALAGPNVVGESIRTPAIPGAKALGDMAEIIERHLGQVRRPTSY